MPTLFLARHATPDWSRTDLVYHLPPGPPLTQQGIAEAQALGNFLSQEAVRLFYTSPLERCLHTAQIAAELAQAEVEIIPGLGELRPGEDKASLRERLWPEFELARQTAEKIGPVCLITHGGPVAFLLVELGMDPVTLTHYSTYDYHNPLPPGAAWRATRGGHDQSWRLQLAFLPKIDSTNQSI